MVCSSEHLTVTNNPQVLSAAAKMEMNKETAGVEVRDGLNSSQRGFRGILVGRVIERDPETGSFSIIVDAVPRVWKNNQARAPCSFPGQTVNVAGVSGRLIDTRVTTRKGETLEFGAIHDGGATLRVIKEQRNVAPVKPGDYPTLPDDFRGFRGTLQAKVISKGEGRWSKGSRRSIWPLRSFRTSELTRRRSTRPASVARFPWFAMANRSPVCCNTRGAYAGFLPVCDLHLLHHPLFSAGFLHPA